MKGACHTMLEGRVQEPQDCCSLPTAAGKLTGRHHMIPVPSAMSASPSFRKAVDTQCRIKAMLAFVSPKLPVKTFSLKSQSEVPVARTSTHLLWEGTLGP